MKIAPALLGFLVFICSTPFSARAAQTTLQETVSVSTPSQVELALGSGAYGLNGQFGWSGGMEILWRPESEQPFYLGLDLAATHWQWEGGQRDPLELGLRTAGAGQATAVHLLPTFLYRFPEVAVADLRPFLGLSVGPTIYQTGGESILCAEIVLRPGVRYLLSSQIALVFQTRVGLLRGRFAAAPEAGLTITLL